MFWENGFLGQALFIPTGNPPARICLAFRLVSSPSPPAAGGEGEFLTASPVPFLNSMAVGQGEGHCSAQQNWRQVHSHIVLFGFPPTNWRWADPKCPMSNEQCAICAVS